MVKRAQVYRCETCGNMVFGLHGGKGELVCCGKPMTLLEEKTADWTTEKHVPVIETIDSGIKVKVGSTPHPMEQDHHIQWIEVQTGDGYYIKFLKAGDSPEATFEVKEAKGAREYCNKHGLWKS